MPGEDGGENLLNKQKEEHEELHVEEHAAQQQENALEAPVLAEPVQNQLQQDIAQLNVQNVGVQQNAPLQPAQPVFAGGVANNLALQRERDAGSSKSKRKQAAQAQEEADRQAKERLKAAVNACKARKGPNAPLKYKNAEVVPLEYRDTDSLVEETVLFNEQGIMDKLKERVDLTGHYRRRNAKKYFRATSSSAAEQARLDVNNLVNNLRLDLAHDCDGSLPEELQEFKDAFYISREHGEDEIKAAREVLSEKKARLAAVTEAKDEAGILAAKKEVEAASSRVAKITDVVLYMKGNASNYGPNLATMLGDIRARELARQQIVDEGDSPYNQLMLRTLDQEIAKLRADYDKNLADLRSASGQEGTPHGDALIAIREQMCELRWKMKAAGDDPKKRDEFFDEGRQLIRNFNYEDKDENPAQNP